MATLLLKKSTNFLVFINIFFLLTLCSLSSPRTTFAQVDGCSGQGCVTKSYYSCSNIAPEQCQLNSAANFCSACTNHGAGNICSVNNDCEGGASLYEGCTNGPPGGQCQLDPPQVFLNPIGCSCNPGVGQATSTPPIQPTNTPLPTAVPTSPSGASWQGASCSGSTVTGCALVGQPACSDWGNSSYSGWSQSAWNTCQTACNNQSTFCAGPTPTSGGGPTNPPTQPPPTPPVYCTNSATTQSVCGATGTSCNSDCAVFGWTCDSANPVPPGSCSGAGYCCNKPLPSPTPTGAAINCAITGAKVNQNGQLYAANQFPGNTVIHVGGTTSSNQPFNWSPLINGALYNISSDTPSGYAVSYSTCYGCTNHPINSFVSGSAVPTITCPANSYVDVDFMYSPNADNAACETNTIPPTMSPGQSANISISMQNSGTTTWIGDGYSPAPANPYRLETLFPDSTGNIVAGRGLITTPGTVSPSTTYSFTSNISPFIAPTTPGTYTLSWDMLIEGGSRFGPTCTQTLTVVAATPTPTSSPTPTPTTVPAAPWIQGKGGDMRIDSGFNDPLPAGEFAFITNTSASNGIGFTGDTDAFFNNNPTYSQGKNWLVGGSASPEIFTPSTPGILANSYSALQNILTKNGIKPTTSTSCDNFSCILSGSNYQHGVYLNTGDVTISSAIHLTTANTPANLTDGSRNIILLIQGNLTINNTILVDPGITLTIAVGKDSFGARGNITVGNSVGETTFKNQQTDIVCDTATHTACDLEGFYIADSSFTLNGNGCSTGTPDKQLNIAGLIAVNGTLTSASNKFVNNRSLCTGTGSKDNGTDPTVTFTERPDMIVNAPDFFKKQSVTWQEVSP